ncbi:hypothetical protein BDR07DRAFT_951773 [Suillus spraguei]|nr:hypothetical protein BDR07DRAFT_1083003 [Suillus spraguei]KAG2363250.1 hypothetical protein BDR07DRAFT_951773 [Suillus spraguei]
MMTTLLLPYLLLSLIQSRCLNRQLGLGSYGLCDDLRHDRMTPSMVIMHLDDHTRSHKHSVVLRLLSCFAVYS